MSQIKTAFAPMRARFDAGLAAKLPAAPKTAAVVHDKPEELINTNRHEPALPPPERATVSVTAQLWLEIKNEPDKRNCAWGFIPKSNPPGTVRIGVVLNSAYWPVNGALARTDTQAVRWLFSTALLERISLDGRALLLQRKLTEIALGPGHQRWESVLWSAYALKDHEITEAIVKLPIYGTNPQPGPHKVAEFVCEVIQTA